MNSFNLKPEWLLYLKCVSETGSITQAAEQLYLREAALKYNLQAMEEHFETDLLYRTEAGLCLTHTAQELLKQGELFLNQVNQIQNQLEQLPQTKNYLNLAAGFSFPAQTLTPLLKNLQSEFPDLQIKLLKVASDEMFGLLSSGIVDLILSSHPPEDTENMAFFAGPISEGVYLQRANCQVPQLYLLPGVSQYVSRIFKHGDIRDLSVLSSKQQTIKENFSFRYIASWETTLSLTLEGVGIGYLPEIYARNYIKRGDLILKQGPPLNCYLSPYLVKAKNRNHPAPVDVFQKLLLAQWEGEQQAALKTD